MMIYTNYQEMTLFRKTSYSYQLYERVGLNSTYLNTTLASKMISISWSLNDFMKMKTVNT